MYGFIRGINKVLKSGMYDYCSLECNDHADPDKANFINKDGGVSTVIKIEGSFSVVGNKKFEENLLSCMSSLGGILKKPGHRLQFVFTRDPSSSFRRMKEMIDPMIDTARRLNLECDAILEERTRLMSEKTVAEDCYLVITTFPSSIDSRTYKAALKERIQSVKDMGIGFKPGEFSQSPYYAVKVLRQLHNGFVDAVMNTIATVCGIRKLDWYEALRSVRSEINLDMMGKNWKPRLLGDKIPLRLVKESLIESDVSHLMTPSIAFQLFNQRPEINSVDRSLVDLGGKTVAPLLVDIPPQDPTPFSELFSKISHDIPWRWSFTIDTGHKQVASKISTKNSFATFLSMFSGDNKLIRDAASELLELARSGETLVMCSMSFCTWADTVEEANRRKQVLAQAVAGWGNAEIIEEFGDSIEAWLSTVPGIISKPIATTYAAPLLDAMVMVPLSRPASPWVTGSVQMRTMDNKVFPYAPGSSKQTAWFDIFFAPPGFGKSFFLAATNMALILNPGNKVLPRIAIIDIGFSSKAFVDLVKSALPKHQRHLAQSFKLEMTKDYTINPFDTPLGCQYPLSHDRESLVNLFTLLLTPAGSAPIPRVPEISGRIIDEMYDYFSENRNPHRYQVGVDEKVDDLLNNLNIVIDENSETSWWQIVKLLFNKGFYVEAGLAQRYAVPTLSDATRVISDSSNIKDVYGEAKHGNEGLISFIESMLASITSDYPILTGASRFDMGSARICSMDLSSVAKGGSARGNKQVGVMYMLARFMCKDFYRNEDVLIEFPEEYRAYHRSIIEADSGVPKKLCMDEFHRTSACAPVRAQAVMDVREGRKFNVHVALLSQMIDDFDDPMIDLANNVFILSKGNEDTIKKINNKFKPSEDGIKALRAHVNGPGKEGSSLLYLARINGGKDVEQVLRLTIGALERWAYSTTFEDVRLREKLGDKVGLNNALKVLAEEFPVASAKDYLVSRSSTGNDVEEVGENIYDLVVKELILKYTKFLAA